MLPDVFRCRSGYKQRTEFLKTDPESLFPDGSGHIFNFCLAPSWAEKTRLENGGTDPRGFAAVETGFWPLIVAFLSVYNIQTKNKKV